jgi:hypothetical protein
MINSPRIRRIGPDDDGLDLVKKSAIIRLISDIRGLWFYCL